MSIPGVQNPHCSAWWWENACCRGCWSSAEPRPSTVVSDAPSHCTANSRHARTASPSSSTVHIPHTPCSHPTCVPVSPSRSRRTSESVVRGATASVTARPLTVTVTSTVPSASTLMRAPPGTRGPVRARRARPAGGPGSRASRGSRRRCRRSRRPGRRSPDAGRPRSGRPRAASVTSRTTGRSETPNAASVAPPPRAHVHGHPGQREVAVASRDLGEAEPVPGRRRREAHLGDAARPGRPSVVIAPTTSSRAGTSRVPRGPRSTTVASRQAATAGSSAAGSAWARLPQTVPRLRSSRWPTKGIARPISGTARATSDRSTVRWRTAAPIRRTPPVTSRSSSPGSRVMSTSVPGLPRRIASTGTSDCPPASTLASPPARASTASSTESGRW